MGPQKGIQIGKWCYNIIKMERKCMNPRIDHRKISPGALKAMFGLEHYIAFRSVPGDYQPQEQKQSNMLAA